MVVGLIPVQDPKVAVGTDATDVDVTVVVVVEVDVVAGVEVVEVDPLAT